MARLPSRNARKSSASYAAMELRGFFAIPKHARTALDILRRSGYNVDGASIITGAHARQCLERRLTAERLWRTISSGLGCGALALIVAAILLPPEPLHSPWFAVGGFVIASVLLGAVAGSLYGRAAERQSVLLDLEVPKDRVNEASHVFRMAGGRFIKACAVPNNSTQWADQNATGTEPLKGAID